MVLTCKQTSNYIGQVHPARKCGGGNVVTQCDCRDDMKTNEAGEFMGKLA